MAKKATKKAKAVKKAKKPAAKKPVKTKKTAAAKKAKARPASGKSLKKSSKIFKKSADKKQKIKKKVSTPVSGKQEPKKTKTAVAAAPVVAAKKPVTPKPLLSKSRPPVREKYEPAIDQDDDDKDLRPLGSSARAELIKPQPRRPDPNQPKPFIGNDTRTRYSDSELQEFREIILKKLDEAKKDYELLKNTLAHKDDHGTDDTSPTFKLLEDGSDVMSKEEINHLAARQEKFIQSLQNALVRIENKTYGICRATGKLIPKERLRVVPHATLSIDAKLEQSAD